MNWLRRKYFTYYDDGTSPPPPPPGPPPSPPPTPITFTPEQQAHVNKLLAENKRTVQQQNQDLIKQLETLRDTANLTAQQKEELEGRISTLSQQHLTDAQKLQGQLDAANKKYKTDTESLTTESHRWKGQFEKTIVTNAILEGSVLSKAAKATQLQAILLPQAKVVEEVDDAGKPTGHFVAKVPITVIDTKTKKPVVIELPIVEAIAKMREDPEHANLFLVDGKPGFGGNGNASGGTGDAGAIDWSKLTPAQHREQRKKLGLDRSGR